MSRSNEANSTIEEWETARERKNGKETREKQHHTGALCRLKMKIYVSKAALACEFQFRILFGLETFLDRITPSPQQYVDCGSNLNSILFLMKYDK